MSKKALATALLLATAAAVTAAIVFRQRQLRIPLPPVIRREPVPPTEPAPSEEPTAKTEVQEAKPEKPPGPKPIRELAERTLNLLLRVRLHHGDPPVEDLPEHEADKAAAEELLQRADDAVLDPDRYPEAKWLSRLFTHVFERHGQMPIPGFEFNFHPRDLFRRRLYALLGGKLLDTRVGAWLEGVLEELRNRDELGAHYLDDSELEPYVPDDVLVKRLKQAAELAGEHYPTGF
ncbi:MAG: hypothetical protein K0S68_911 [Candidatus Saccharibacteria bacterium]|nr:hypothetical protein [Candidatus Saccharibacteria bacterium]